MKNFTDIFIHRPILSIVVSLLIVIAGAQSVSTLTVREFPRNDNSIIIINTAYIGASAELVRGFITTPIESAINAAEGVEYIESTSAQGLSTIRVRLKLNFDPLRAVTSINTKLNKVRSELPTEAEVPEVEIESADDSFASGYISFQSDILKENEITDFLDRVVRPQLLSLEGVLRLPMAGDRKYAMRIWLKPEKMAAHNVTPAQVRQALTDNNYLSSLGKTKGSLIEVELSANTNLETVDQFKQLSIRSQDGAIIRLKEVADVELGSESYDSSVTINGEVSNFLAVYVSPTANSLEVMSRVSREFDKIKKSFPVGLNGKIAYDATEYIQESINEVVSTLIDTLIIVIAVIFLFLGSLRSILVPIIAIPISLVGSIFLMSLFGFSLNLLTLLAIVLSVGLVVDDAIVVVENVQRHIREGLSNIDAALVGARELVGPVIATTIVLVAVYLPVGLQGGLTGVLFKEFAFTLASAVIISSIVALTLSPIMSASFLNEKSKKSRFSQFTIIAFENIKQKYAKLLDKTLLNMPAVILIWIVLSILCIPMFLLSPAELAPTEDSGFVVSFMDSPPSPSKAQTEFYGKQVTEIFSSYDETDFSFQLIFSPTNVFWGLSLKPWDQRDKTVFDLIPDIQTKGSQISGINLISVLPPSLPGGGQFPLELLLVSSAEPEEILEIVNSITEKAMKDGIFAFPPIIDTKIDKPQARLIIDKDKAADLGLTLRQVGNDVGIMLSANFVNRFSIQGNSYKVIPQAQGVTRQNISQLNDIYISGPNDQLIPLSTVATIETDVTPRALKRFQLQNAVKISGVPKVSLAEALAYLEEEANKVMPLGYGIEHTGESRQLVREGNKFLGSFGLAILLIFLVLSIQFNSFRDPIVIILGCVPLAMFGSLIFMFLKMPAPVPYWTDGWTTTLNIYSQVGLVTLIGLIAKNGILVVEFANKLQIQGISKLDAIKEAALTRLRPILMTSVATAAGHFPLVMVTGAGAEARNSIGLVLVGGMAIGTILALFVVPAVYMLIAKDHSKDTVL